MTFGNIEHMRQGRMVVVDGLLTRWNPHVFSLPTTMARHTGYPFATLKASDSFVLNSRIPISGYIPGNNSN